jgi:hypothetical protein
MEDDIFILDAVTHAFNNAPDNYADEVSGRAIAELSYAMAADGTPPEYALPPDVYLSDWQPEDVANMLFHESNTDVAIIHPLQITAFKDGWASVEKAAEARERWPQRFVGVYAAIDPLDGRGALEELERQVDMLKPIGLKLYPTSWSQGTPVSYRMDDPKIIFPIYEKAAELGIKHVAFHKAVPFGPIPVGDAYDPSDLQSAAATFPDMTFEIVHGGVAFVDETAWLLGRFDNIYVNMELHNIIVERRPRTLAKILLGLCHVGGKDMLRRLFWGTGTVLHHPRPGLEAFLAFEFPDDLLEDAGLFGPIGQITHEDKAAILGGTYASVHGIDIEACKKGIEGDEFAREPGEPLPEPYSTITRAGEVAGARANA